MSNSRKRSLCIITPAHWYEFMGGSQYQIKCLLDELLTLNRYDVTYLANRVSPDFHPEGYTIIRIGRKMPRLGYMMHAIPLYRALRKIRPDVIYQRVACGYTGVAAYYARRHNSRIIWHVAHDSDVTPDRSMHGRNALRRLLEKRSVEYGIRRSSCIVTQTEHQAALLQSNYGRIADAVVPNFHPQPTEDIDKSGPLTVLWVANLKPWKRPDAFVELARRLIDLKDVRFIMVGALMTDRQNRYWGDSLLSMIKETPNLNYLGQRSQDEVNELMAQAHVFVNTSQHEGFANTFIQAWAREVPVVSLHVNPDSVLDRERIGLYAGSEEQLTKAVRLLLTNDLERKRYADRARAYASKQHSLQNAHLIGELIDTGRLSSISRNGLDDHAAQCAAQDTSRVGSDG